ncbi:14261_t:CDS:10 [Entrophospora sp. SA101]|nr:14261_t:CDS:10 [Entrophospora sp. SA101]
MSNSNSNSSYLVVGLLEKMDSSDTDFRYMATNDLMNELQKDGFTLEEQTEKKVVQKVIKLMDDANGEVQNLAVKCLAPLVKKVREAQLQEIVDQLCLYSTQQGKEELRDIAGIGLKTIIVEIPSNSPSANNVLQRLIPRLLLQLENPKASFEVQMDTLDILSELLARFGTIVASNSQTQKKIQNVLIPLLKHSRAAFRKRTTVALGNLVTHDPDDLFNELVQQLLIEFRESENQNDKLKTLIQCVGTLSRSSAPRLGKHLPEFLPIVIDKIKVDDDELRENCLQALESFVLRCPTEMSSHVYTITDLGLTYAKYDPNLNDDLDDDNEEEIEQDVEMETEDEEDEDEDEGDYSDDDDISWKVRRASLKLLSAVIATRHELLSYFYQKVAPVLVSRFREREESVRVDDLQTFIVLLRQTLVYGTNTYIPRDDDHQPKRVRVGTEDSQESPKQMLRNLVPRLSRNLHKQLLSKSIITKQTGFILLRELITVLNGGLENHLDYFVPAIETSLSTPLDSSHHHHISTNSNLKIETLSFLRQLFKVHPAQVFHPHLTRLCPPIIASVEDKFYKITSEAFLVCIELIKVIRPIEYQEDAKTYNVQPLDPTFKSYILDIYNVTKSRLSTTDADQEVKERSIVCLGVLISQAGDNLKNELKICMPILLDRLRNEVTRLTTVKTFTSIADSPVCKGQEVKTAVVGAINEVAVLLRKSHRQLKVASLVCLEVFIRSDSYTRVLEELTPLISDQDLHLLPLALNTVVSVMRSSPSSLDTIYKDILPSVFRLVQSTLVQGAALDSLLIFFETLIATNQADFSRLFNGLMQPAITEESGQLILSKQAYSTIAQCMAVLCVNTPKNYCSTTVDDFINKISNPQTSDSIKYLSLLAIGEIGRKIDLSQHANLHVTILSLFSAPSEDTKSAAAFALGNLSAGNVSKYLPIIIEQIAGDQKQRYLLLHALKEIISRYSNEEGVKALGPFADKIWNILFDSGKGDEEEGTRSVVAECLGKLTLANPNKFLPELQKRLRSTSAQTRGTVVTAVKFTFINQGQQYDELLRPIIIDFLSLIKDGDLNVRRLSLGTLNSAAHNKPHLIRDVLNQLLPLLYEETVIKEHLIHMVEMGPFKHKVDDGLDIRKSAYECMYTLLETCLDKLEIYRLDETVDPLKGTLTHRMKDNAVKSEIDKNNELCRSAIRVVVTLSGGTPKFDAFVRDTKVGHWSEYYNSYQVEMGSKEFIITGHGDSMDTS